MIAFGSSMTSPEAYERFAQPGIERAAEPDSVIYPHQSAGSIARSYNLMCDLASAHADLEALVLVHQDAEIIDDALCAKVRKALADERVGVAGCAGATGASTIAWWEGTLIAGGGRVRYGIAGGGDLAASDWPGPVADGPEAETLDGYLLALSPWAVRNLRFDEGLGQLYGHDHDICHQARAAGRAVVVTDIAVAHHHSLDLVVDTEPWIAAHVRTAEKWDGGPPADDPSWRARARHAEAQAALARLRGESERLQGNASVRAGEEALDRVTRTLSWRLTAPLRRLNHALGRSSE